MALIDENAGYHPRLTHWWWSGGTAVLADGRGGTGPTSTRAAHTETASLQTPT